MKIFLVRMTSIKDYWLSDKIDTVNLGLPIEPIKPEGYIPQSVRESSPVPMPVDGEAPFDFPPSEHEVYDAAYIEWTAKSRKYQEAKRMVDTWRERVANRQSILDSIGVDVRPVNYLERIAEEETGIQEVKRFDHLDAPQFSCTGEQLIEIMGSNDKCDVISTSVIKVPTFDSMALAMASVVERFEKIDIANLTPGEVNNNYNNKCEVHIPGQALATYNEVMLLEDVCSDVLQNELDNGWRIIAGCPQPDNRRPDYILGRFNSNYAAGNGAARASR